MAPMRQCLLVLAATLASLTPGLALGATGTISASPSQLILANDATGTATIGWTTSGAATAQVYVSIDGAPETLFATGAGGSADATFISAWHWYVFTLYEGTEHTTRLAWTSVNAKYGPASTFGNNYYMPYGLDYEGYFLHDVNWPALRPVVEADLDYLASQGTGVIRLALWPHTTGWRLLGAGEGGEFTTEGDEVRANLPEFLALCHERNIQVIAVFANVWFSGGNGDPGHRWWMNAYDVFGDFLVDTAAWMRGFVEAIEASPYANAVIFYDYENETYANRGNMAPYLRYVYDSSGVPEGKRGVSVLWVPGDIDFLISELATDVNPDVGVRRLDFIDFHSYPAYPHLPNIEQAHDYVKTAFPDSTIVLGEFGRTCAAPSEEVNQQTTVLDVMNRAIAMGVSYFCHFTLWDDSPPSVIYGLGYDPHAPKDVLGGIAELTSMAPNPDMEAQTEGHPTDWTAAGTVPLTYQGMGLTTDAATNGWYARIHVDFPDPGYVWFTSAPIPVAGGGRAYMNSFVRSGMQDIRMVLHEYDEGLNQIAVTNGPAFTPVGWSWNNYLQRAGSHHVDLMPDTRHIIIGVTAETEGGEEYLDLDTVSLSIREPWVGFPATLAVLSPNGGEVFEGRSSMEVAWDSVYGGATVDIEYSTDGGGTWTLAEADVPNAGSYTWSLPDLTSYECLLRITDGRYTLTSDTSDGLFSIVCPEDAFRLRVTRIEWSPSATSAVVYYEANREVRRYYTRMFQTETAYTGTSADVAPYNNLVDGYYLFIVTAKDMDGYLASRPCRVWFYNNLVGEDYQVSLASYTIEDDDITIELQANQPTSSYYVRLYSMEGGYTRNKTGTVTYSDLVDGMYYFVATGREAESREFPPGGPARQFFYIDTDGF